MRFFDKYLPTFLISNIYTSHGVKFSMFSRDRMITCVNVGKLDEN